MAPKNQSTVRINISLPADLLARIDAHCAKHGISRSSFLRMAAADYIREAGNDARES